MQKIPIPIDTEQSISPLKSIRKKCMDCSNNSSQEIELCPLTDCPLYPLRFGKMPKTAKRHFQIREQIKQQKQFEKSYQKT